MKLEDRLVDTFDRLVDEAPSRPGSAITSVMRRGQRRRRLRQAATATLIAGVSISLLLVVVSPRVDGSPDIAGSLPTPAPTTSEPAFDDPPIGRVEPSSLAACSIPLGQPPHGVVVEAYATAPWTMWDWWQLYTEPISPPDPWIDVFSDDPITLCLTYTRPADDTTPAWNLFAVLPDGVVHPIDETSQRPTNLPIPHAEQTESGPSWQERLNAFQTELDPAGQSILVNTPPDQPIPRLIPPTTTDATISRDRAEAVARQQLGDLGAYQETRTFLADYESFGPGSAVDPDAETSTTLVWAVMVAPVEVSARFAGGTVEMIQLIVIDAHTGTVVAEITF